MKKINILTKSVYNKIAAGEVVDRPYSVVKELVENSLDAGATGIEVHIESGGKQLIKVIDNGCGIDREDMRAAFFPHATSKIATAEDIEDIATLGFRGEALASISAVSKVELTSVTEGNPAYSVKCIDATVGAVEPATLEKGTEIIVRDLFYNVPARANFLRADKKEESDISNFMTRFILGNPFVSFRYFTDGKLTLQSDGTGLDEAVARVYGTKTLSNCFKINVVKDSIKIYGFIGNQNFYKPNKTYQSVFLNGRYVMNYTVSAAVSKCYDSYIMKRQYPFYILFIEMPAKYIDVNVHPNKMDVRILASHSLFSLIYDSLNDILDGTAHAADFVIDSVRVPEIKSNFTESENQIQSSNYFQFNPKSEESVIPADTQTEIKYYDPCKDNFFFDINKEKEEHLMCVSNDSIPAGLGKDPRVDEAYERRKYEQQMIEYESCKYKGNLFNTYLMYEICDKVYIIDQHAAHERLIYDRLREKIEQRKIDRQILLEPYLFTANVEEAEFIETNIRVIRSLGFDIEPFGTSAYKVDEVPVDLQNINIEDFFNEILSNVKGLSEIKLVDILKDKIAMTACKHAIKGGMKLTDEEIEQLFLMLKGNVGLKCPHGRPVCVLLEKKDIEKMFKRIV